MNVRLLLILSLAVAGLGAAAWYFGEERQALHSETFAPGPLFEGLEATINDVDEIRLESQEGGVLTLDRHDGGWVVEEQHDYPANVERVNELLKRVATLQRIEQKTALPENHPRLQVDDPAGPDALGTRITLSADGEAVADMVVGLNLAAAEGAGTFVRRWQEDQTWLAEGEFAPRRRKLDLLQRSVVNVDGRRIQSARIERPSIETAASGALASMLRIVRPEPEAELMLDADIPEGMRVKPERDLSSIATAPDFLIFEDVRPAAEVEMDRPIVGIYETFDGLRLIFRAQRQGDDAVWVTVTAQAAARWDGLETFVAAHAGQDSEAGRIADQMKTAEEVNDEIVRWTERASGWAYKLTDYKTDRLQMTLEELIEPAVAADGEIPGGETPGGPVAPAQ